MGFDNMTTVSGLFYIISVKDGNCGCVETVLSWNHFWGNALQQPSFTPFSYNINNVFEYLELFELNDPTFYSHCKNNKMDIKLWEKKENSYKELLNIPIKLHPFFDTFSNPKLATQFQKMPVASFTDWIDVKIGSSPQQTLFGKIQVALAIGTTDQLNAFKNSRNITAIPCTTTKNHNPMAKKGNPTALADMLSTFIDNLALSLPKRTEPDQRQQFSTESRYQLRRTSDLLDVLHSALKNPAPANLITSKSTLPFKGSDRVINLPVLNNEKAIEDKVCIKITIDSARNLTGTGNTESCYNNENHKTTLNNDNSGTYVSFEAIDKNGYHINLITKTAQHNCNPFWDEKFNVFLPRDLLQQNNKMFLLKILRKVSTQRKNPEANHLHQDEPIGVTAIDLRFLTSECNISGYHNVVDAAGRNNGQIKINISLADDINNSTEETELPNNLDDPENGSYNVDNVILNRTLKRKFTELEAISQRLKSRLLDVTDDDAFDVDDEFENDLNTCPVEDDVDSADQFDWNRFSMLEIDCDTSEPDTETATFRVNSKSEDHVDILAHDLKHFALNNSNNGSNKLSVDEKTSANIQTPE